GFVRSGFRPELDAARTLRDDSRKVMAELEAKYLEETGIRSLKVRHNNILGFYVEVPAAQAKPLLSEPLALIFRHRQTMAGALRFATEELLATESRIVTSADRALALEQEVFAELAGAVATHGEALGEVAAALGELDCEAGLAEVAAEQGYVRPVLDDSPTFEIRGGRHPVVEQALQAAKSGAFIANHCGLAGPGFTHCAAGGRGGGAAPASGSSPDPIWPANLPSCARTRSAPCWRRWARSCRRAPPQLASSTACSPAWVPLTTLPAAARRL